MNNLIQKINSKIKEFLQLPPHDVKEGQRLGKEISVLANEISDLVLEQDGKEKYNEISSRVKKYSLRLTSDFLNSKKSPLIEDWERFAQQDKRRLRDEILSLQEFLNRRGEVLRKRVNEEIYGIDIRDLSSRLQSNDFLDGSVCARFSKLVKEMETDEIQTETKKHDERLKRISNWLLLLEEVERVEG